MNREVDVWIYEDVEVRFPRVTGPRRFPAAVRFEMAGNGEGAMVNLNGHEAETGIQARGYLR